MKTMAYSEDLRKKVMEYIDRGNSQRKTRETFHISMDTINKWRRKYEQTGEIKNTPMRRKPKKLPPEELRAYVKEHPDAYLKEIGEVFGCSDTAVQKALKRLNITRKKRVSGTRSKNRSK